MKKRICIVVSDVNRVVAFEALVELIDPKRFELEFLLLNSGSSQLEKFLMNHGVAVRTIHVNGRLSYPIAFLKLLGHLLRSRPALVNTHLVEASLLALPAAWLAGVRERILTRHHSTFHHVHAPRWVTVDKLLASLATHVIAVSPLVARVLEKEGTPAAKITTIEHGFHLEAFSEVPAARVDALRSKYKLQGMGPVIGVVSRYIRWKGVQHILPAFRELLTSHPRAVLCLANAAGPDTDWLRSQMASIPEENLREIEFEPDLHALFRCFDVFVHVPVNEHCEAFGQVYVEALASGLPCVFTASGIAADLAKDGQNALMVPFGNPVAVHEAIERILTGGVSVEALRARAVESVRKFGIREMIEKLSEVYGGRD